jgi:hypothetical protein
MSDTEFYSFLLQSVTLFLIITITINVWKLEDTLKQISETLKDKK